MKKIIILCWISAGAVGMAGCGPAYKERFVEIGPNETAFVIPLEGATLAEQGKLNSLEYLEKAMVMSKRVTIPQQKHYYGRSVGSYRWIPQVLVISVDRAPVTREWTSDSKTGTSTANQALQVESLDSINFALGATITCRIDERDTPTFLYFYGTQPLSEEKADGSEEQPLVHRGRPLIEVVDANVRSYCQARLSSLFGSVDLNEGKVKKTEFFRTVLADAKEYFRNRGITIESFGSTQGLYYDTEAVQQALNRRFVTENAIEVARQELAAQKIRNERTVAMAHASRHAAEAVMSAQDAMQMKYSLEIKQMLAQARRVMAERWDGAMPANLLPTGASGSNLLLEVK